MHGEDSPSSAFSLGDKDARELNPAGIKDRPVNRALAATLRPGFSPVPEAVAVMAAT
jgi:hypothetical protein